MNKKQPTSTHANIEKILTVAGLILIAIGCIANLFSLNENARFINNDPLAFIYYSRYFFLLGGGFAIGYLLTKKPANKLFGAVFYTVLTLALFYLIDIARFGLYALFDDLAFPWGKILFYSAPIFALIIAVAIAYISRYRKDHRPLSPFTQKVLVFAFIAHQVYTLASGAYFLILGAATYPADMPLWLIVGSYLTLPLAIAIVSYVTLNTLKRVLDRLFYSALIGTLYAGLAMALWEFRTDASIEATNTFSTVVNAVALISVGILLWRARIATK